MKKLLTLVLFLATFSISSVFAVTFITFTTPSPQYGCPNTTHDVTIGATNTSGSNLPPGIAVAVTLTIMDNTNTNTLGSYSQSFSTGLANGATKYFTIPGVVFQGPMICNVTGNVSFTFGVPQNFPINTTYTVQPPPDLTISQSPTGTLNVSTPLNGYSVNYYLNGNYLTTDYTTTATSYAPANAGSYTAKGYDPVSNCLSVNPSIAVIIRAAQTITFPALSTATVGDADYAPGATSSSGLDVTYITSDPSVATIVSGNIHIVGAGSVTITAQQAGDATNLAATDVPQTLLVKDIQTITFPALSNATVGDADILLDAVSTNSGIAITYTTSNAAVATIVSGSIHIVGAGSVTITAHQAGDANYTAATDVPQTFTVNALSTGVDAALAGSVTVYPNPASDILFVAMDNTTANEGVLTLTDVMGFEISKIRLSKQGNSLGAQLSVSQLAEGIYFLQIQTDSGVACKKITKR